jgi:phosphate transport system substrate-binding protein
VNVANYCFVRPSSVRILRREKSSRRLCAFEGILGWDGAKPSVHARDSRAMTMKIQKLSLLTCLCTLALFAAKASEITGAGSTFVYPILSKWSVSYRAITDAKINYQSIGSGGGIAQIKAATVTFGASDMPMKPADLESNPNGALAQFPVAIGGVVPVVNLPNIKPGDLKLTGQLLVDIFMGKITKWNDPAIVSLNPGLPMPDRKITVVHRSDGSGTTFTWVDYLCKVGEEWKSKVGEGTSVSWPTGVGGKGNEGVAAYVKQIAGSIGYVELAYVLETHMTYAQVKNKAGNFVAPSIETFQAAAAAANWSEKPDFYLVITDAAGENAWPIAGVTWAIMYKQPKDAQAAADALGFFKWALEKGQDDAKSLDYVALPSKLVDQIENYWAANIHVK